MNKDIIKLLITSLKREKKWEYLYKLKYSSKPLYLEIKKQSILDIEKLYTIYYTKYLTNDFAMVLIQILKKPFNINMHYINRVNSISDKIIHLSIVSKLLYKNYEPNKKYIVMVNSFTPIFIVKRIRKLCRISLKIIDRDLNIKSFSDKFYYPNSTAEWIMLWLRITYFDINHIFI